MFYQTHFNKFFKVFNEQKLTFASMFRKAVAILLAFFLMWGNAGFCLNVHYCSTAEAVSFMVNHTIGERCGEDDSHDAMQNVASENTKSCCKKLEDTLPSKKDNCCSDTEVEVKITDAFQGSFHQLSIQKQFYAAIYIPLADCFYHSAGITVLSNLEANKPPDIPQDIMRSGQEILVQYCTYRI